MKKLFIFIFILFSFVTQNLHAKDFFYEIYGLTYIQAPSAEVGSTTKIKSKG